MFKRTSKDRPRASSQNVKRVITLGEDYNLPSSSSLLPPSKSIKNPYDDVMFLDPPTQSSSKFINLDEYRNSAVNNFGESSSSTVSHRTPTSFLHRLPVPPPKRPDLPQVRFPKIHPPLQQPIVPPSHPPPPPPRHFNLLYHPRPGNQPPIIAPRPTAAALSNITNTKVDRTIQHIVEDYYRTTRLSLPPYLSYHPFVLTRIRNVSKWQTRKCARDDCRMPLGNTADDIVVTHFEPYSYVNPQTGNTETKSGVRVICPSLICIERRYPFVKKSCFVIDPSVPDGIATIDRIVRDR
uniref:Uncharacterized protein n=1 Tax=Panagrolaimus sp. ES5 TaxID=591445 RepID=A0AC34G5R3_9BILA